MVTGQHCGISALADADRKMVRGMPGRRHQPDMIVESVLAADQIGFLRLDDRQHAVGDRLDSVLRVLLGPVGVLLPGKQVAGVREGRNPPAILQACVPSDVIGVQMSAHDKIDVVNRDAGSG